MRSYVILLFVLFFNCVSSNNDEAVIDNIESKRIKREILHLLESGNTSLEGYDSCFLHQRISSIDFDGQFYNSIYKGVYLKYIAEPFINYHLTIAKTPNDSLYIFGFDIYKKLIKYNNNIIQGDSTANTVFKNSSLPYELKLFNELIEEKSTSDDWSAQEVHSLFDLTFQLTESSPYWSSYSLYNRTFYDFEELNVWMEDNLVNKKSLSYDINFRNSDQRFECVKTIFDLGVFKISYSKEEGLTHFLIAPSNRHLALVQLDNPPVEVVNCSSVR